jgi:hypothetical protein
MLHALNYKEFRNKNLVARFSSHVTLCVTRLAIIFQPLTTVKVFTINVYELCTLFLIILKVITDNFATHYELFS